MYSGRQILQGIKKPSLVVKELRRNSRPYFWKYHSITTRLLFRRNDPKIIERDWDNLLLIDACRFDLFEELNDLQGALSESYSVASRTSEFVDKTFEGVVLDDTVCVTASPKYYERGVTDSFHACINIWEEEWDDELCTVPPEVMNDHVLQVYEKYPEKRILAHYIQPHIPFIGKTGKQIEQDFKFRRTMGKQNVPDPWKRLRRGELDEDIVWQAYRENHEIIIDTIAPMLDKMEGKNVVTSDHGNAFGTWGLYGHPARRHIKELIQVPYLEFENGSRKNITAGEGESRETKIDDEIVQERLADLGYLDQ